MIATECLSTKLADLIIEDEWGDFDSDVDDFSYSPIKAHHEWNGAIASLEKLLSTTIDREKYPTSSQGIIISSPTPVINNPELISRLTTVVFTPAYQIKTALMPSGDQHIFDNNHLSLINISLHNNDTLNKEQFCLIFTDKFSLLMVKDVGIANKDKFYYSFNPEVTAKAWFLLVDRLTNVSTYGSYNYQYVNKFIQNFLGVIPNYRIVEIFNKNLVNQIKKLELTELNPVKKQENIAPKKQSISLKKTPLPPYPELELLQALTHEIRTPLTTIKTITKLLQKKAKLNPDLGKYLETIEQECTEQINRMELIFKAVELESQSNHPSAIKLVPISLESILNQIIPSWQKQAQRRNIILDVILPQKLPQIVSDPAILSQILSGLMEKFTRSLPSGCHFKLLVLPVGNQLKLQFLSESNFHYSHSKCLGKLLLFQPETGSLSLSNDVTKNIFHAIGGKFTIKQKPNKGEILTIFLPLGNSKSYSLKN